MIKLIDLSLNLYFIKSNKINFKRVKRRIWKKEMKKNKNRLNNAIEIYKNIIFEDINSNSYDKINSNYNNNDWNIF